MNFILEVNCEDDMPVKEFEEQLTKIEGLSYEKVTQNGFDGNMIVEFIFNNSDIIVATIEAASAIILKIISRNDVKSVKVNNMELKGYSLEDVEKLLSKIDKDKKHN